MIKNNEKITLFFLESVFPFIFLSATLHQYFSNQHEEMCYTSEEAI